MTNPPLTLLDKLWRDHVVRDLGDDWFLLQIDRHLLHDISGPKALADLSARRLPVVHPSWYSRPSTMPSRPGRVGPTGRSLRERKWRRRCAMASATRE